MPVVFGIALTAAVANAYVQVTVSPERELSPIVVGVAVVIDRQQNACARGIGAIRVARRAPVLKDPDVVARGRVVFVWWRDGDCAGHDNPRGLGDLGSGCEAFTDLRPEVDEAFVMP